MRIGRTAGVLRNPLSYGAAAGLHGMSAFLVALVVVLFWWPLRYLLWWVLLGTFWAFAGLFFYGPRWAYRAWQRYAATS